MNDECVTLSYEFEIEIKIYKLSFTCLRGFMHILLIYNL